MLSELERQSAALLVEELDKVYADGTRALRGLSLTIPAGCFFGLLGPNGSGKSTLIGMVAGLVRAPAGRISVFGHDDRARAAESVRAHWPGYAHRQGRAVFLRQIRSLRTQDTLEIAGELTRLDGPAAVVWGGEDPFQKLSYGRRLASDLHTQLDAVDGARHFVPEDHPERVTQAIASVLARVG